MSLSRRCLAVTSAAVLGLSLSLASAPAHAQSPDPEKKVTVTLKDIPLRAAIDALFAGSGYQYSVNPDVANVPVNLNIRDVGLQAALRLLVRQAAIAQPGVTFSKESDLFVIKVRRESLAPLGVEDAPPEYVAESDPEATWEKIPIQFNNVAVFVVAFGGQMLPTEFEVLLGGAGGLGGNGGFGGYGGGGYGGGFGTGGNFGGGLFGGSNLGGGSFGNGFGSGLNGGNFGSGLGNSLGSGFGNGFGSNLSGRRF